MFRTIYNNDGPEISDAIISFDSASLARLPVRKSEVIEAFLAIGNKSAAAIVERLPAHDDVLDEDAVDRLLIKSAIMMFALAIFYSREPDKNRLWSDIQQSAQAALQVYVPYATLVFIAMVMRVIPSVDLKSIACTVLLGPLLFIRPAVAALGIFCAANVSPRPSIIAIAIILMALMLVFERLVERWYERNSLH